MDPVLNISAYLFTPLTDREQLRETLLARARAGNLKGTVLIAPEGINLFLAGDAVQVRGFLHELRRDPRFADLGAKESWSADQPFRKMLVKLKNEIIRMDHPAVRPADGRAPSVAPDVLRRWLDQGHDDEGREVVMLDTRNAFEVEYGTFTGALDWRIERFTQFPAAVEEHRDDLAGKTVVTFCTGGIRCEKAAIVMDDLGVDHVLQLEGGILTWFEQVGADHFEGGCFVFDDREVLTPQLRVPEEFETRREPRRSALA
ncbi:MAG: sulfurtransferase [Nocardioides sp.]|uniref:sulfurtransferase n=1 Tax=Nocardioides sp. TaxID=35761 RepID=UPI003F080E8D